MQLHLSVAQPKLQKLRPFSPKQTADCLPCYVPGGIGKTRLAIKVASALASEYADGSYFVPLQAVDTVDLLIAAIADILEFSLASQEKPLTQLLKFLRTKETLLVLDNFEQLINHGGTSTIDEFLSVAPASIFWLLHAKSLVYKGNGYTCSEDSHTLRQNLAHNQT